MTEHLLTEDDEQWAKPNLDNLLEYMTDNAQQAEVNDPSVVELHVVPSSKRL